MTTIDLHDFVADVEARIDAVPGLRQEMRAAFADHNELVRRKIADRIRQRSFGASRCCCYHFVATFRRVI